MKDETGVTVSAAEALAIVEREQGHAAERLSPDARLLFAVWGVTWGAGFLLLWLTAGDEPTLDSPAVGGVVFGVLMVAAMLVTGIHIGRRVRGVHGRSATTGQRYAAAWIVAFAGYGALMAGLDRAGASDEVLELMSPLLACLVVGLMYMAGGALWDDPSQFLLGAWITVAVGVAAIVGVPDHLLVMSVLGGGGFLVGAALASRSSWRR
jgi:hypothetical protein